MKTVYYKFTGRIAGAFKIEVWTKADKSNRINLTLVTTDPDKIRARVEDLTGLKRFDLVQVK